MGNGESGFGRLVFSRKGLECICGCNNNNNKFQHLFNKNKLTSLNLRSMDGLSF